MNPYMSGVGHPQIAAIGRGLEPRHNLSSSSASAMTVLLYVILGWPPLRLPCVWPIHPHSEEELLYNDLFLSGFNNNNTYLNNFFINSELVIYFFCFIN